MEVTALDGMFNRAYWKSSLSLEYPGSESSSSRTANFRLEPTLETCGFLDVSACNAISSLSVIISSRKELSRRFNLIPGLGDLSIDVETLQFEVSGIEGERWLENWLIEFATKDRIGGEWEPSNVSPSP